VRVRRLLLHHVGVQLDVLDDHGLPAQLELALVQLAVDAPPHRLARRKVLH
jgi:hypothetical protein